MLGFLLSKHVLQLVQFRVEYSHVCLVLHQRTSQLLLFLHKDAL